MYWNNIHENKVKIKKMKIKLLQSILGNDKLLNLSDLNAKKLIKGLNSPYKNVNLSYFNKQDMTNSLLKKYETKALINEYMSPKMNTSNLENRLVLFNLNNIKESIDHVKLNTTYFNNNLFNTWNVSQGMNHLYLLNNTDGSVANILSKINNKPVEITVLKTTFWQSDLNILTQYINYAIEQSNPKNLKLLLSNITNEYTNINNNLNEKMLINSVMNKLISNMGLKTIKILLTGKSGGITGRSSKTMYEVTTPNLDVSSSNSDLFSIKNNNINAKYQDKISNLTIIGKSGTAIEVMYK